MEEWTLEFIGSFNDGFTVIIRHNHSQSTRKLSSNAAILEKSKQFIATLDKFYENKNGLRLEKSNKGGSNETNISIPKSFEDLNQNLKEWSQPLWQYLPSTLQTSYNTIRLIIKTNDLDILKLPWETIFPNYVISYSFLTGTSSIKKKIENSQTRILCLIDKNYDPANPEENIETDEDSKLIEKAFGKLNINYTPSYSNLSSSDKSLETIINYLLEDEGYLLFLYAGHGKTEEKSDYFASLGDLEINKLRSAFKKAISQGLYLAIFNCCDGLGCAEFLYSDSERFPEILTYTIVMRQNIPAHVVLKFFKFFIDYFFEKNKDIDLAVKDARLHLEGIEEQFPGASWHPVLFRNTAEPVHTWESLKERYGIPNPPPPILLNLKEIYEIPNPPPPTLLEMFEQELYNTIYNYCTNNNGWLKITGNSNTGKSQAIKKVVEKFRAEARAEIIPVLIDLKKDGGFLTMSSVYEFMIHAIINQVQIGGINRQKFLNSVFCKDLFEDLLKQYLKSHKLLLIFDHFDIIERKLIDELCTFFRSLKDNAASPLTMHQIWKKLNLAIIYSPNRKNSQPIIHQFIGQGLIPIPFKGASM